MSWTRFSGVGLMLGLGWMPAASPAHADGDTCNDAYTGTQRLRRAGKLRAARTQALACGQDVCSPTVRMDCVRWLDEIERATPSILVDARDEAGHELSDLRVEVDGELLTERLDGKQIFLDPGNVTFRCEHLGQVVERQMLVREGEKYRTLRLDFVGLPPSAPVPVPVLQLQEGKPVPAATYVLGGVAAVGFLTFAALATSGYITEMHLRDTCGSTATCTQEDVDSVHARYLAGDIALGAGLVSLAVAGALWALAPASPPQGHSALGSPAAISGAISWTAFRSGGAVGLGGRF